jgi:hypothetical protein
MKLYLVQWCITVFRIIRSFEEVRARGFDSFSIASSNGTVVQGQILEKEKQHALHRGDEVLLGRRTSGTPPFQACLFTCRRL